MKFLWILIVSLTCVEPALGKASKPGEKCPVPRKIEKCSGDTANLPAYGKIKKNVTYSWFTVLGSQSLTKTKLRALKLSVKDKTLTLPNLKWFQSARYSYRPSSSVNVSCSDYDLRVSNGRLKAITRNWTTAIENGNLYVKVEAFYPGKAKWYLNNKLLPLPGGLKTPSKHFKYAKIEDFGLSFGSVLDIKNIQKRHAGQYKMKWIMGTPCKEKSVTITVSVTSIKDMQRNTKVEENQPKAMKKNVSTVADRKNKFWEEINKKTTQPIDTEDVLKAINKINDAGKSKSSGNSFLAVFLGVLFLGLFAGSFVYFMTLKNKNKSPEQNTYGAMFAEDFTKGQNSGSVKYQPIPINKPGPSNAP